MIKSILIANRGEIAVRIIRTCRELGLHTVTIYSDIDINFPHVRMADEAVHLHGRTPSETYLRTDRIIGIAKEKEVDAIHPGYGFLAENPVFAEQVERAGLIYIGPSVQAIKLMGDKTEARHRMLEAGVPVVPGTDTPLESLQEALETARNFGYPVLIKAAAGGGGKGMRVVHKDDEMSSAFNRAQSEAMSAFGDSRIYIEKYLQNPRHVEFQVLADKHGNTVHLGERECSIQRRYQKVIEESPSPVLTRKMREEMGQAAVRAAKSVNYLGAGTIEFLVDKNRNFYFLEMNTRIQVEHPVTESRTGVDLVAEQIRVANGEPLSPEALKPKFMGHAIECRVYAEDPSNNFVPSIGKIINMFPPDGFGVRFDGGVTAGNEITPYYDPMIGKLIAFGRNREEAIQRMLRAIDEFRITGVKTSLPFCREVLKHKRFITGDYDTHFVDLYLDEIMKNSIRETSVKLAAALAAFHHLKKYQTQVSGENHREVLSPWKIRGRKEQLR